MSSQQSAQVKNPSLAVVVLAAVMLPCPALSQEGPVPGTAALETQAADAGTASVPPEGAKPGKRFWFRLSLGSGGQRPRGTDIENGMRVAGLDQGLSPEELSDVAAFVAPIFDLFGLTDFTPPSYPRTEYFGSAPRTFALGYRLRRSFEIEVMIDRDQRLLSLTMGHSAYPSADLSVEKAIRTYAALAAYRRGPARVGLGLSINSLELAARDEGFAQTKTRPGLVAETALAVPSDSRLFVELAAQYHYVPPARFAAIPVHDGDGRVFTEFPSTPVHFSRWTWSFGVGFRL